MKRNVKINHEDVGKPLIKYEPNVTVDVPILDFKPNNIKNTLNDLKEKFKTVADNKKIRNMESEILGLKEDLQKVGTDKVKEIDEKIEAIKADLKNQPQVADMLDEIKLLQDEAFDNSPKVKKLFATIEDMQSKMEQLLTKLKPEEATAVDTKQKKKTKTKRKETSTSNDSHTTNEDKDNKVQDEEKEKEVDSTEKIPKWRLVTIVISVISLVSSSCYCFYSCFLNRFKIKHKKTFRNRKGNHRDDVMEKKAKILETGQEGINQTFNILNGQEVQKVGPQDGKISRIKDTKSRSIQPVPEQQEDGI